MQPLELAPDREACFFRPRPGEEREQQRSPGDLASALRKEANFGAGLDPGIEASASLAFAAVRFSRATASPDVGIAGEHESAAEPVTNFVPLRAIQQWIAAGGIVEFKVHGCRQVAV